MDRSENPKMHIEIPAVSQERWALWFSAVILLVPIVTCLFVLPDVNSLTEWLLILLLLMPFLAVEMVCLVSVFAHIHLVPEGYSGTGTIAGSAATP